MGLPGLYSVENGPRLLCVLSSPLFLRRSIISVIFAQEIYGTSELLSRKLAIWLDLARGQKTKSI